jgi:Ca-activated chloride channel family protein
VAHAIQLLSGRDRLAVVVYDDEVDTLLGQAPALPESKALATGRLREIDARGSTDLAGGWLRGLEETAGQTGAGTPEVRRVLLLSDGLANRGETNPDRLAEIAAAWRAKGIATTTFGLGADFDEVVMSRLAREGGGNFYFIEDARQIPDYFTSELGETLDVVARDATFDVAMGPGTRVSLLNDYRLEEHPGRGVRVRLGDLVSGQVVTLVFAVHAEPRAEGETAGVECRVTDRDNVLGRGAAMPPMRVQWKAATPEADAAQPVNETVLVEAATLVAAQARAAALEANRRGDVDAAQQALRAGAAGLCRMGAGIGAIERLAAELEAETEEFIHRLSPMRMKSVHADVAYLRSSRTAEGKARRRPPVS